MARKLDEWIPVRPAGFSYIAGTPACFLREDRMLKTAGNRVWPKQEAAPHDAAKGIFFSVLFGGLLWLALITPATLAWLLF